MLTPDSIEQLGYSEIVGIVRERNRPSGGLNTINTAITFGRLTRDMKVLEVGCNTGFTSVNLSLLSGCEVVGVDINAESISEARRYSRLMGTDSRTRFQIGDATSLPFPDNAFDFVWCSNVTAFIEDKNQAIKEYLRVLRLHGTLAVVPIYYRIQPPDSIVAEVGKAISASLSITSKEKWIQIFKTTATSIGYALELYHHSDYAYHDRTEVIEEWVQRVCDKPHMQQYSMEVREAIKCRLTYFADLFNRNLRYCGFSIFLFQLRKMADEMELFYAYHI